MTICGSIPEEGAKKNPLPHYCGRGHPKNRLRHKCMAYFLFVKRPGKINFCLVVYLAKKPHFSMDRNVLLNHPESDLVNASKV